MQYDDGILANAFYFAGSYESGLAHGMKFDVGVDFDVLAASIKVLSDGDAYWPWPDGTHGPIRVMVFDDNNGVPGNLLHDEEAIAEDGWATVYPGLTGLSGSFYVIASHDENWTDYEGFGVDGSVDYPDNMFTYYYGLWETGDYLGYGGDYMVASQVMAYGNIETLSSSLQQPAVFNSINSEVSISVNDGTRTADLSNESHPIYQTRDLQTFDLYRDGELIVNLDESTYSYIDQPLNNMTEYCYTLGSTYDEGVSEISDPVCVTPYPGPPASDLIVEDLGGIMSLSWNAAIIDPLFGDNLINYQIYKDGVNIGETISTNYIDSTEIIAGIDYCYQVKANYPSGETFGSNTDCGLFYLDPPVGLSSTGNNDDQHILICLLYTLTLPTILPV